MKKSKIKILSLALTTVMMSSTLVMAAEGDHYDRDGNIKYTANEIRSNVTARNEARAFPSRFQIEVNKKVYSLADANEAYKTDKTNYKQVLEQEYVGTPVEEVSSDLKVESVSAINNTFRATKAVAAGMEITIEAKDKDGKEIAKLENLDEVIVKIDDSTLINVLDYTVASKKITVDQGVLNSLTEGTHTVSITLDGVKVPNQTITVTKLEAAGLEASLTAGTEEITLNASGANLDVNLVEYDAVGGSVTSINLNGSKVFLNGTKLTETTQFIKGANKIELVEAHLDTLDAGVYTVKVELINGLTAETKFEVVDESKVSVVATTDEYAIGDSTGKIELTVSDIAADGTTTTTPDFSTALEKAKLSVKVNGSTLGSTRYTGKASGVVELDKAYLEVLGVGEHNAEVTYDGKTSKAVTFNVVAGATNLAKSSVTPAVDAALTKVTAGEISSVTYTFKDAKNNPIIDKAVTFTLDGNEPSDTLFSLDASMPSGVYIKPVSNINDLAAKTDAQGKVTLYFNAKTVTSTDSVIKAKVDTTDVVSGPIAIIPGVFNEIASTVVDASASTDPKVTLTVKDKFGNDIEDLELESKDIELVFSGTALAPNVEKGAITDNADGTYTIEITNGADGNIVTVKVKGKVVGKATLANI